MELLETDQAMYVVGVVFLWALFKAFRITKAEKEAEMRALEISDAEKWSRVQTITSIRQISIEATLRRIEIALACILLLIGYIGLRGLLGL